jgi:hypothetical protein
VILIPTDYRYLHALEQRKVVEIEIAMKAD